MGRVVLDLLGVQLLKSVGTSGIQPDFQLASATAEVGIGYGAPLADSNRVGLSVGAHVSGALTSVETELYARLRADLSLAFLGGVRAGDLGIFIQMGLATEKTKGQEPASALRVTTRILAEF